MGEVHHPGHAEDHRQPGRDQEQRGRAGEPGQQLDEPERQAASAGGGPQLPHLGVGRQRVGAVHVAPVHHHAVPVLQRELADERAQRALMVDARGTSARPNGVSNAAPAKPSTICSVADAARFRDARRRSS